MEFMVQEIMAQNEHICLIKSYTLHESDNSDEINKTVDAKIIASTRPYTFETKNMCITFAKMDRMFVSVINYHQTSLFHLRCRLQCIKHKCSF